MSGRRTREQTNGIDSATVRCAIYTRKSSEEGLDQEFNSLDAQRESAEAFIASQKAEGWTVVTPQNGMIQVGLAPVFAERMHPRGNSVSSRK